MANWLGIVAEYNPFHSGHLYHINQAMAANDCQGTIVAMSGNFVQRGEPAIMDKWVRSRMAIEAGADLVVEIPCWHVLRSAEGFARAGIGLLTACGADTVSFGSEGGNLSDLQTVATWLNRQSSQQSIRHHLKSGISYAAAVEASLRADSSCGHLADLLAGPNNILALEYLRAAATHAPALKFHTVRRVGPGHRSSEPDKYASASALRRLIVLGQTEKAMEYIPTSITGLATRWLDQFGPVTLSSLQQAVNFALLTASSRQLRKLPAISEGLENRLLRELKPPMDIKLLLQNLATRRYPMTRLQRILCQLLLGFQDIPRRQPLVPYIRVLAMSRRGKAMLPRIVQRGAAPLVVGWRDTKKLSPASLSLIKTDQLSGAIHGLGCRHAGPPDWQRVPYAGS